MAEAKILKNILATNLLRGADFWQALKWIRLNRKDQKSGKIYDLTDQDVSALRIDMMEALHIILQVVFETLRSQRKYAEINAWNLMNRLLYVVNPKMALDRQVQLLRYNAERGDKKVRALLKIANTLSRSDAPVHPIEIGRDGYQECYEAAAIRLLRIAFKSAQDTELDISPSETQEQLVNARLMNNAEAARIFGRGGDDRRLLPRKQGENRPRQVVRLFPCRSPVHLCILAQFEAGGGLRPQPRTGQN